MFKFIMTFLSLLIVLVSFSFGMEGTAGTEVFYDANGNPMVFNKINIQPEFGIGKIKVGLDLVIYFDQDGNIRETDWDNWSSLVEKIYYVKFAEKGDPFYFHFGAMKGMSIGHGMIFNRYSNLLLYPDIKKAGLVVDVNLKGCGIEMITTNIIRTEVMGARVHFRPFYGSGSPLLSKISLGVSGGIDGDPDSLEATKDDEVSVTCFDIDIPILNKKLLKTILFADVAQMSLGSAYTELHPYTDPNGVTTNVISKNNGKGTAYGILGKFLFLDYKLEYKRLENNFIYGYFDRFYEIERPYKANTISSDTHPIKKGPYAELAYSLMNKVDLLVSYEDLNNDTSGMYPWVHGELNLDKSVFGDKMFLKFAYDKQNVQNWDDISKLKGENAVLRTEIGYAVMDQVMMVLIKEETYDKYGMAKVRTTLETRIVF